MAEGKGTRLELRGSTWYIVVQGRRRGRSTRTSDRRQAERVMAAFIAAGGADEMEASGVDLTVADALHHYWTEHASGLPSAEGVEIAADYLRAHMGHRTIASLHDSDFIDYAAKRRAGLLQRRSDRPAKVGGDSAIRRELGVLAAAIHHETRKKDSGTNRKRLSLDDVPHIPKPRRPPPRERWLTAEEERHLIESTPMLDAEGRLTRIYRFLLLALDTAARKEAIEGLTWFQVDLQTRTIQLNPPGRQQTKKRRANVRMSDRLYVVLQRAAAERISGFVLDHDGSIRKTLETATRRAGFDDVTAHVFRHTWATRAARAGVSMREIADVLGDDMETVERNYMHHHPDFQKDAVNWRDRENGNASMAQGPAVQGRSDR